MDLTRHFRLRLGVHKANITPPHPVHMSGYGSRQELSVGVHSDIFLRAFALEVVAGDGSVQRAFIATADIILWDPDETAGIREELARRFDLCPDAILLNASHSHSGPTCHRAGHPLIRPGDDAYCRELTQRLIEAARRAFADLEDVSLFRGEQVCEGLAINRRKVVGNVMEMRPNPDGPRDDLVTVLRFDVAGRGTKAALVHWTCHPTILADLMISSEFPGYAMETLEADGFICGFLQGCCGDIRPHVVNAEGRFVPGEATEVAAFGAKLAATVREILQAGMRSVEPGPLKFAEREVHLPFQPLPSKEQFAALRSLSEPHHQLRAEVFSSWHGELPKGTILKIQALSIAPDCGFVAFDGEVVVGYGHYVRKVTEGAFLPLGYSNGLVGYVPTDDQILEGGYESERSQVYFMKPAPYAVGIEGLICQTIDEVTAEVDHEEV